MEEVVETEQLLSSIVCKCGEPIDGEYMKKNFRKCYDKLVEKDNVDENINDEENEKEEEIQRSIEENKKSDKVEETAKVSNGKEKKSVEYCECGTKTKLINPGCNCAYCIKCLKKYD